MTTFAPHRDTLESFVDCINGGADKDTLTGLLAEDVVLYGPFGDEPIVGREVAVETIKTVNGLSSDDTYLEVLSGETHHAAHFRLQVGDAAVNGIFFVLLDADGKIAEVSIFYRTLPAGVALQRNLADVNRHAALGTAHERGVTTRPCPPSRRLSQFGRFPSASTPPCFVDASPTRASGGGINLFDNQSREDIS